MADQPPKTSVAGMNPEKVEEERPARLALKRERTDDVSPPPLKRLRIEGPTRRTSTQHAPPNASTLKFPLGVIKKTWVFGFDRRGDDITIAEVIEKETLRLALFSCWQADYKWIMRKVQLGKTKVVCVAHAKELSEQRLMSEEVARSYPEASIRFCFPTFSKQRCGSMHSKLMLLFHDEFLRVVVPSANLTKSNWGETGFLENSVFLLDLPLLPTEQQGNNNNTLTPFAIELRRFLTEQGIDNTAEDESQVILPTLSKFDFSNTTHLAFIHSIAKVPESQSHNAVTGYAALAKAVQEFGLGDPAQDLQITYAASSVGKLSKERLSPLKCALRGVDTTRLGAAPVDTGKDDMVVLFPSKTKVDDSPGARSQAAMSFLSTHGASNEGFQKRLLRVSTSLRDGCLSHTKMIVAQAAAHTLVYCGSHNVSKSAWGPIVAAGAISEGGGLSVPNNWECGVLVVAEMKGQPENENQKKIKEAAVRMKVSIPFRVPAPMLADGDAAFVQTI